MLARAVAIILYHHHLLVIRRTKLGTMYYVLPGGSVEPGEIVEAACVREVKEETGLDGTIRAYIMSLDNGGRIEHYFAVDVASDVVALGHPEAQRQTSTNQYTLEWIAQQDLASLNLQPEAIRSVCQAMMAGPTY